MKLQALALLLTFTVTVTVTAAQQDAPVAIALHGGAGTITKDSMTPEMEAEYIATLSKAARHGHKLLLQGEAGENVVVETLRILETSPLFNAGIGAVYTYDGEHELDASIMHGGTMQAGAVAGVKTVLSPITAAREVMNASAHVLLAGEGAEQFAREQGLKMVENSIFDTPHRREALERAKARMEKAGRSDAQQGSERFGTVGAVVLDSNGNLVAGTSTGGMTAKRYGRVGDSPIIGAGTYADNASCAVSATGHGEFFIRYHVAADICARMKYQNKPLSDAADEVVNQVLAEAGGDGGVIAIDRKGNIAMPFNSEGMYRAKIDTAGNLAVGIYKEWAKLPTGKKSQ